MKTGSVARRASLILMAIGLVVSIYMTIYKVTENNKLCLGSGDCATVNASRYSEVNGVPVALIGVAGYAALLGTQFLEGRSSFMRENGPVLLFGLALAGFLFTAYLVYVEVALLRAFCPFCVTSQVTMTLIFLLSLIRLVGHFEGQEDSNASH